MGRLVVSEFITLDGVVEAPGGEFHPDGKTAWVVPHFTEETGAFKLDELHGADALLLGRATYEQFAKAWPTSSGRAGLRRSHEQPAEVRRVVHRSTSRSSGTRRCIKGDISEVVAELKGEYERDILIGGSAGLVHTLIRSDVIDEYRLMIFPVVLGSGKRLFRDGIASLPLRLVHTAAFKSGVVVHSYEPTIAARRDYPAALMRTIGSSDLSVFPLCLGGNIFGWTVDEPQSFAVLDAYAAAGGNFIDTADSYSAWAPGNSGGESETIIGNWMAARGNRDEHRRRDEGRQAPGLEGLAPATIRTRRRGLARAPAHRPDRPLLRPHGRRRRRRSRTRSGRSAS